VAREREVDRRLRRQGPAAPPASAGVHPLHGALLSLQRQAGNQAVARMLARTDRPRLQRMQLIATEAGTVESDPVVLMNMRHARAVNQGRGVNVDAEKIASLADSYSGDDLDFANREIVFMHGHGLAGMYRDEFSLQSGGAKDQVTYEQAADVVAAKLKTVTNEAKRNQPYEIRILTCHGGDPKSEQPTVSDRGKLIAPGMPSLVKSLQTRLADAPNKITIKGFVEAAFSYPAHKTYQEPAGFTDKGFKLHLEAPFEQFKQWLETEEGKQAGYRERLKKIEELVPQSTVESFMDEIRKEGAYSKKDAATDPTASRRDTFLKVFNRTT
jgi:hypothetical protein